MWYYCNTATEVYNNVAEMWQNHKIATIDAQFFVSGSLKNPHKTDIEIVFCLFVLKLSAREPLVHKDNRPKRQKDSFEIDFERKNL